MKNIKKRYILMLYVIVIVTIKGPSLVNGSTIGPETIRVGLRSAYANKASIPIESTQLQIGYESGNRFIPEETLTSPNGFIVKVNYKNYYDDGRAFSTYNEAYKALSSYNSRGLVAYKGQGNWRIYLESNMGQMNYIPNDSQQIILQDKSGRDLIISNSQEISFAGIDQGHSFNLTKLPKASYRGWFQFVRRGNTITAVNIVNHEEYLYGVIPAEMPASWHIEALKAQAVAARSMSIYQSRKYINEGYNVCDTVYTQVYKGYSGEYESTNRAVDETRGIVATYNGRVAETLFFSTSGGYTEDPKYVWGNEVPYLKSVKDPYETDPEMKPWTRTISLWEIEKCLSNQNINIGSAKGVRINSYTPAGRVKELEIIGTGGSHKITRENIRTFFSASSGGSLRSRMFTIGESQGPIDTTNTTNSMEDIVVYQGGYPNYIIGADGMIRPVGDSLVVWGPSGQVVYGRSSGQSQESQVQYGDIHISGRGYGHGVGMSQSGAKGMANAGYSYDEILKYYYQGIELER